MCQCGLQATLSHIGTVMRLVAAEPRSIALLLFLCQYLCETILSDTIFDRVGLPDFKGRVNAFLLGSWSLAFCFLLFSISPLSFYGLVLWGWGLRTDMVSIALFHPCITIFFNNNNNYFFPYSRLSFYLLRLFLYLISFLQFPFTSVWENTRA